jgi:ADP-ribose pyrophosphatase YjhB (NUDIX family)
LDEAVRAYLEAHPAHYETIELWPVIGRLRVRLGLGSTLPPAAVSSSILAIVFDSHRRVLFLHPSEQTGSIVQLLIGGRPEPGETPEQTAAREVAEETGWKIEPVRMIGFRHFFHLEPHVPASDRPYPDFIQPIFAARAVAFAPEIILAADRIPAEFLDFDKVEKITEPVQRPLLQAARDILFAACM